mmetsp:Transcript_12346/g.27230  ORF Transcript_12346/g.27230 Transcript_12346/m.27230 type:complete len:299 (+) Transcript_12346:1390-2286(+)
MPNGGLGGFLFRTKAGAENGHGSIFGRLGKSHEPHARSHTPIARRGDLQCGGGQSGFGAGGPYFGTSVVGTSDPFVECIRKDEIGQFRLMIAFPPGSTKQHARGIASQVATILAVILHLGGRPGEIAGTARMIGHARGLTARFGRLLQQGIELLGQQKVTQMIGLHLHVVPILGGLIFHGHDPGIVAQHMDLVVFAPDCLGRVSDRRKVLQIARNGFHVARALYLAGFVLQGLFGCLGSFGRSIQEQHVLGVFANRRAGDNEPGARRGARNGHRFAFQRGKRRFKLGEPFGLDGVRFG